MTSKKQRFTEQKLDQIIDALQDPDDKAAKIEILKFMKSQDKVGGFISWFLPLKFRRTINGWETIINTEFGRHYILRGHADVLKKFNIDLKVKES